MKIGQLCTKISGREAKHKCVVVDIIDDNSVLIDGDVKRRKCNIKHLEPSSRVLDIKKGASNSEVIGVMKKEGFEIRERKLKEKKEKPVKKRKVKIKEEKKENGSKKGNSKKISGNSATK